MNSKKFLIVVATLCFVVSSCFRGTVDVRIAAGRPGSGIHALGTALAELFNTKVSGVRARVVESADRRNSLERVLQGEAELAIAFSDSEGDGEVRTLVPLYELYLYIIVWTDGGVTDVPSLKGRRVGIGPAGGGTDTVTRQLLEHYRFGEKDIELVNSKYRDMTKGFLSRKLDAVFVLGSIESRAVERLLRAPGAKLLSLDDPERVAPVMDGIRSKHPFVVSHIIPKHLFGTKPKTPTGVIGVNALLVASSKVDDETARRLTQAVFEHKVALGTKVRRLREINERFDPATLRFPLHPGAAQYYRRDEPPAIMRWAETISLFITILMVIWSASYALVMRRRLKRKGTMDGLFKDFQKWAYQSDDATPTSELKETWRALQDLRRRAFDELAAGRVEANSGFVVFHDYLRAEVHEIERVLRSRKQSGIPPSLRQPDYEGSD